MHGYPENWKWKKERGKSEEKLRRWEEWEWGVKDSTTRSQVKASNSHSQAAHNQHPITQHTACIPPTRSVPLLKTVRSTHASGQNAHARTHTYLHVTTRMSASLYDTDWDWLSSKCKTSEVCFNRSTLGGSKEAAAAVLWAVTCQRAAEHLPYTKNTSTREQVSHVPQILVFLLTISKNQLISDHYCDYHALKKHFLNHFCSCTYK